MSDLTTAQKRTKAHNATMRRLRKEHEEDYQRILRDELAKFGLEPAMDKRRARAEAALAEIARTFPDLVAEENLSRVRA